MLDSDSRSAAAQKIILPIEFLRIELSPLKNGDVSVALTATSVDELDPECFELVDQDLASEQLPTIDEALALVSKYARRAFATT